MAQALALVKRDLGSDAVVLHTRSYKRGGIMGLGARNIVEVTAGRGSEVAQARRKSSAQQRAAALPKRRPTITQADPKQHATAGDLIRKTYAAARAEIEQSQQTQPYASGPATATLAPPAPTMVTSPVSPDHTRLAKEMDAVKQMVSRMMHDQRSGAVEALPKGLSQQYAALLQQEVACELADEIVAKVRRELSDDQLQCEQTCREAVCKHLATYMPTEDEVSDKTCQDDAKNDSDSATGGGGLRKIALVGPTGVGKTTTIAKLAATFKIKQKKNVALVTLDTYRIAAVDQLRTYAGIIGVPLHVVLNPDEMKRALERCARYDVVLIDTAGRSQRDDDRLGQLSEFLKVAEPDETHLVLSSTCSQQVLMETVERFSRVHTDRIIFTKLDEAVTFGVILNVLGKADKRLSYITTGQEVPHQIEPGRSSRIAELVLGSESGGKL